MYYTAVYMYVLQAADGSEEGKDESKARRETAEHARRMHAWYICTWHMRVGVHEAMHAEHSCPVSQASQLAN